MVLRFRVAERRGDSAPLLLDLLLAPFAYRSYALEDMLPRNTLELNPRPPVTTFYNCTTNAVWKWIRRPELCI